MKVAWLLENVLKHVNIQFDKVLTAKTDLSNTSFIPMQLSSSITVMNVKQITKTQLRLLFHVFMQHLHYVGILLPVRADAFLAKCDTILDDKRKVNS